LSIPTGLKILARGEAPCIRSAYR